MPTCAIHPSQASQFESQPLSQHTAVSHTTEASQCSFGGGAPLAALAGAAENSDADSQGSQKLRSAPADEDEPIYNSERQEIFEGDDDYDSQALLEEDELVGKLSRAISLRGRTLTGSAIDVAKSWLRHLSKGDTDRQNQERSLATVVDFFRLSGVRSLEELLDFNEQQRQWWLEAQDLDSHKEMVLALHKEAKARAVLLGDVSKADTSLAGESKVAEACERTSTPTKTQGADMVAETPDSSLDAERSGGTGSKTPAHTSPKHVSPKRCMASVRIEGGGGPAGPSLPSRSQPAEKEALPSEARHGAKTTLAETLTESAGDASCAAGRQERAVADATSGDKRRREDEGAVQGGGEAGLVEQEDAAVEEQVESHRRGAEKSYSLYHDLLAKRARLTREVGSAKQLEKTRQEIARRLEKDAKAALAARARDVREAEQALAEAEKKVWAAKEAQRKQASAFLALEAELKEVTREQQESNERLKGLTAEFHVLLAKNNKANGAA